MGSSDLSLVSHNSYQQYVAQMVVLSHKLTKTIGLQNDSLFFCFPRFVICPLKYLLRFVYPTHPSQIFRTEGETSSISLAATSRQIFPKSSAVITISYLLFLSNHNESVPILGFDLQNGVWL